MKSHRFTRKWPEGPAPAAKPVRQGRGGAANPTVGQRGRVVIALRAPKGSGTSTGYRHIGAGVSGPSGPGRRSASVTVENAKVVTTFALTEITASQTAGANIALEGGTSVVWSTVVYGRYAQTVRQVGSFTGTAGLEIEP